jgi:4-amino-4-deoxy-L-arabinose transferase-like glycosyltransferase
MVEVKNTIRANSWITATRFFADLLLLWFALQAAIFFRQHSPVGETILIAPKVNLSAYWLILCVWGMGVVIKLIFKAKRWIGISQVAYSTLVLSFAEYLILSADNPSFSRLYFVFFAFTNLLASLASRRFSLLMPEILGRLAAFIVWVFESTKKGFAAFKSSTKVRTAIQFVGKNRQWIPPLILIVITALFFWPARYRYSSDVGYYLSLAKNLFHGQGYVIPDLSPAIYRGPVFPLLISASYIAFGEAFRSALILERIFWIATILVTYFLGRELFGNRVGFWAALFVLFAGAINFVFGLIWTDGPLLLILLALQLLCWKIYKNQRGAKWYALLGFLMGIAYLLKQTALFIVPLPLLMWVVLREYRTRQNLLRLLLGYLVFACFFFGWMGYVYLAGGSGGQITSDFDQGLSFLAKIGRSVSSLLTGNKITSIGADVQGADLSLIEILVRYYHQDIVPDFKYISLLFPISLIYSLYQAFWKRSRPDIFLGIGLLLFATLIPVEVIAGFGTRHNIYFYVVLLIACTAMLERLLSLSTGKTLNLALAALAAGAIVWISVNYSPAPLQLFTPTLFNKPIKYFTESAATAQWINQNIDPDANILVRDRDGNFLHVLTSGNRRFETLNLCEGEGSFLPAEACAAPYPLFWTDRGITDPNEPRDRLLGISEPWLISAIKEKAIDYVIVTPRVYVLYYYLEAHPDFQEVARLGSTVIFKVIHHPVQPISIYTNVNWEPCIGEGTADYLRNLKQERPENYNTKITNFFVPWMGLSRGDIESYQNWKGCVLDPVFPGEYPSSAE